MKIKVLAASVALAFAGNAAAIEVHTGTSVDFVVNIGGATASTKTIRDVIRNNICASDVDTYNKDKHWVVACVVDSKYNVGAVTPKVLFRKADDGSSTGVIDLDKSLPLPMTIPDNSCTSSGTDEWDCTSTRVTVAATNAQNVNTIPDIGTSDVEPALFVGSLAGSKGDFTNQSGLSVSPLAGLNFGVVVTTSLRNTLQNMQFTNNATWTIDERESEEFMPSLSSAALRSLFSGRVGSWINVQDGNGNTPFSFADISDLPSSATVHICRREPGSGTHATTAANILGTNCAAGATAPMVSLLGGGSTTSAPTVTETNGSGDMTDCMNAAQTGTAVPSDYEGSAVPTGKRWAIGYQSVEKGAVTVIGGVAKSSENTANDAEGFRFIKIDGYAPTLENMHRGNYYNFSQSTIQIRGGADGAPVWNDSIVTFGAESQAALMYNDIANLLGDATNLVAINAGAKFDHSWKNVQGGWLGDPNNPNNTPDLVLLGTNPVNTYARTGGNTCQNPVSPSVSGTGALRIAD